MKLCHLTLVPNGRAANKNYAAANRHRAFQSEDRAESRIVSAVDKNSLLGLLIL